MRGLKDKVAIVTGATRSMGGAVADRLAAEGARVVACSRGEAGGQACVERIRAAGGQACYVQADLSREEDVQRLVERAVDAFGALHLVANIAAATELVRGGQARSVIEESTENWHYQMLVNAYGPFWLYKYAIPQMLAAGGGAFVHLSTLAATRPAPDLPSYCASKAALEGLSRQVATQFGDRGIRSNCVMVGTVKTPENARLHEDPVVGGAYRATRMTERPGSVEDIASICAFLLSEEAGFITGANIPVEGGALAKFALPSISAASAELARKDIVEETR